MTLYFPRPLTGAAAILALSLLLQAQEPAEREVGQLYATDASVRGSVIFASGGAKVLSGASVVAGNETALLDLDRGGNMRFCPRTSVSVASTPSGSNLMLGMNTGQIEVNYSLADSSSTDAVVTPDFRLLFQGPGNFHFAVGADKQGNTCVRALKGNTGAVTVTELMGDTSYQVRPAEEVVFRAGRISQRQRGQPSDCGCPEPSPLLRAAQEPPPPPPPVTPEPTPPPTGEIGFSQPVPPAADSEPLMALNTPAPPPETHLQVDAPFVFSAEEESPIELVTRLRVTPVPHYRINVPPPPAQADPPAESGAAQATLPVSEKQPKRSLLRRVGSFLTGIFH